jgi:hypothetical protein
MKKEYMRYWIIKCENYFHNFTELSRLAEATIPVAAHSAKAEITFSCAGIVMLLFSAMFHSSKDCTPTEKATKKKQHIRNQ